MEELNLFDEIGFTKNEGKVYDTLIKIGKSSAAEISSKSGVPYGRIYNVLSSLVNKGLVEVIPEKTKKFTASSPDTLLKLVIKKEKFLEHAKEKLKKMQQFYDSKNKNPVTMVEGRRAFYKVLASLKEPEKYSYSIKWSSEYKPNWALKHRKNLKNKVDMKVLTRYDKETEKDVKKYLKINKNIRKIDNEGVAFSMLDDSEAMISLIKSNVTLVIRDKAFVKLLKKMFLETYKNAEKIK